MQIGSCLSRENEASERQLSTFLSRQRRHLYTEEMKIYPVIERTHDQTGPGRHISAMVPLRNDPVFGERTRSDYERLYREIEGRSK